MDMNFTVARSRRGLKAEDLRNLSGLPQLRESVLRYSRATWSPTRMFEMICQKVHELEAAAIQVVGTYSHECSHCEQELGPFLKCVSVPGNPGCANCHWVKAGPSCSLNPNPTPRKPTAKRSAGQTVRLSRATHNELLALLHQAQDMQALGRLDEELQN